ncbi:Firmicu-CTERM sorting domain-containing protein [[Clostridium] fimetarium]|uniref:Firmicu-CTERM domain-containing protein n=1 Tax=[Clostridium] fimetarium TaxID=99656 RepID=A0A1I0R6T6_9FIRM|nr:Firmicu-CTERM sorting domain-containing protein [[Clostridium] fimetarium]SEW36220.1 hypothetical protein SAMN05421659_11270 [[Clostridium] fimetarium]
MTIMMKLKKKTIMTKTKIMTMAKSIMKQKKMKTVKKLLALCSVIFILSMYSAATTYASNSVQLQTQTSQSNTAGIAVDGYYDDWVDKPMSKLTWNSNNGTANHDVSLIKDDNYIYIYVGMHPNYNSPMPIDAIYLSINNVECQLFVRYVNAQNTVDWGHQVNLNQNGTFLGLHPFTYYPNNSLGDAAITVSQGNPNDRMEIRINIKDLEKVMSLKSGTINNGSQIKLRMPNVGGGSIELLGTSTGALLGIILCAGTVIIVKLRRNNKARLV